MKNIKKTEPITMKKRIGSTTYEVNAYFNPEAKETVEKKILRILKNELTNSTKCAILNMSQIVGVALSVKTDERSSA